MGLQNQTWLSTHILIIYNAKKNHTIDIRVLPSGLRNAKQYCRVTMFDLWAALDKVTIPYFLTHSFWPPRCHTFLLPSWSLLLSLPCKFFLLNMIFQCWNCSLGHIFLPHILSLSAHTTAYLTSQLWGLMCSSNSMCSKLHHLLPLTTSFPSCVLYLRDFPHPS